MDEFMMEPWEQELEKLLKEGRENSKLVQYLGISPEEVQKAEEHSRIMRNFALLRNGIPYGQLGGVNGGDCIPLMGYKAGYSTINRVNGDPHSQPVGELVRQPLDQDDRFRKRRKDDPIKSFLDEVMPEIQEIAKFSLDSDSTVTDEFREDVLKVLDPSRRKKTSAPSQRDPDYSPQFDEPRLGAVGYYVGAADALFTMGGNIADVVAIYNNAGVIESRHVQRKLKQFSEKGPSYRAKLVAALHKYSVV